jgi:predicted nuclease of predicted toxin-antitoxin system
MRKWRRSRNGFVFLPEAAPLARTLSRRAPCLPGRPSARPGRLDRADAGLGEAPAGGRGDPRLLAAVGGGGVRGDITLSPRAQIDFALIGYVAFVFLRQATATMRSKRPFLKHKLSLYFDENIPDRVVRYFRSGPSWRKKVKITSARELGLGGRSDRFHYDCCQRHKHTLVTLDLDFDNDKIFPFTFGRMPGIIMIKASIAASNTSTSPSP